MKKSSENDLYIANISNTNVHHQSNTSSPICCILQLESGLVVLGLYNGNLYFYAQNNLKNPSSSLYIDKFPISSIIQVQDDQLLCSCSSFIYLIFENNLKKLDYFVSNLNLILDYLFLFALHNLFFYLFF